MKFKCNDEVLAEITETEKLILQNDLYSETLEEELKRRVQWVLKHKVKECEKRMLDHWMPILMDDPNVDNIPASKEELINLIVQRKDYKNRSQKEQEKNERDQG